MPIIKTKHFRSSAWLSVLSLVVLLFVSGCTVVGAPAKKEEVTFRLGWKIKGEYAPFFVALEKGYYDANGLSVSILEGQGSASTVQLVSNLSDTFGYSDISTVARSVGLGVPIKVIACTLPKSPAVIISYPAAGIKEPKDLEGKTLAQTPGDAVSQIFPAFVAATGIDSNKVNQVSLEAAAKSQAFLQKKVDAITAYSNNQLPALEDTLGIRLNAMMFADYGINLLGSGIIAHNKTIEEKPELARRFVQATIKGWEYAVQHPAEAAEILEKRFPQQKKEVVLKQLAPTFQLIRTKATEGKPIGWQSEQDWKQTLDLLEKYGGMQKRLELNAYYTNQFLPK